MSAAIAPATLAPNAGYPREYRALFDEVAKALPIPQVEILSRIAIYASDLTTRSLTDHFLGLLSREEIEADRGHYACAACRRSAQLREPDGLIPVPASPARDLLCLADLYFIRQRDEERSFRFFDFFEGIDILEYEYGILNPQVLCYDIIFYHEPWYDSLMSYVWFETSAVDVQRFLTGKGYVQTQQPRRGQAVVFVHANRGAHYARVESVDLAGELTLISKFGNGPVYRHKLDRLPTSYGFGYMLFDPPRDFPALYTSPKTIRMKAGDS